MSLMYKLTQLKMILVNIDLINMAADSAGVDYNDHQGVPQRVPLNNRALETLPFPRSIRFSIKLAVHFKRFQSLRLQLQ